MAHCRICINAVEIDDFESMVNVWKDYVRSMRKTDARSTHLVYRRILSQTQLRALPDTLAATPDVRSNSRLWLENLYALKDPRI